MSNLTFEDLSGSVGRKFGPTDWFQIDQARINAFADATLDHQWIHTDVERAKGGPFGTTVAHGYLTLSLLVKMIQETPVLPDDATLVINYGLGRVRFPAPVKAGSRVRLNAELASCEERGEGRLLLTLACEVEVEGGGPPALVAEVLYLVVA